ncbi:hypothetical protein [Streptosporangium sp. KLBMP 9127]|nr:hypothetical protein [Streptosporangium sp. KLBMP 9127]
MEAAARVALPRCGGAALTPVPEATVTLLPALLVEREVTDALVDLLIATMHRVGAPAERKVTEEPINAFKRVWGKENLLFTPSD